MFRHIILFVFLVVLAGAAHADGPWAGQWQLTWRDGSAIVTFEQDGPVLRGSYANGRGLITGSLVDDRFEGENAYDGSSEKLSATLSPDGSSFAARTADGDWLNGLRMVDGKAPGQNVTLDLTTPRSTLRSFVVAGNRATGGNDTAVSWAVDAVDFGKDPGWATRESQFEGIQQLFDLIDLATFSIATIPVSAPGPQLRLSLPRLDSKPPVELDMLRGADGLWRIAMPSPAALRKALEAGGGTRPADAYRQLQNPRDTLRSFLDGMAHWDTGGDSQAIATIDLSHVPEVLRFQEGSLLAQYLVRLIDRVGNNVLQNVPNSGSGREPFVYFDNPAGRIVIEPVGNGADTRWKFSAETARDARKLYRAVEQLPEMHALAGGEFIPYSPVFALRDVVKAHAPVLLGPVGSKGRLEYWQILGALLLLTSIILGSRLFRRIYLWLLSRHALKHHFNNPRRLSTALGLGTAFAIGAPFVLQLGLPAATRQYSLPVVGSLLLVILTYAAWQLIAAFASMAERFTERTESTIDNILLTFVSGVARLAVVVAAGLGLSQIWSLPTTGLLAGLGVSGLAIAFASKETLSNVFGAGILLGDRPFRKGDRIIAGDVNGWVEAVGLRSTRIRTLYDSLLIVPNGKLADMTVNNLGARRRRTFSTTLTVTSGATPERLQDLTQAIVERISADPIFSAGATEVSVTGIATKGVQLELSASLNTTSGRASREATHQLFLDIMRLAAERGLALSRGMALQPDDEDDEPST